MQDFKLTAKGEKIMRSTPVARGSVSRDELADRGKEALKSLQGALKGVVLPLVGAAADFAELFRRDKNTADRCPITKKVWEAVKGAISKHRSESRVHKLKVYAEKNGLNRRELTRIHGEITKNATLAPEAKDGLLQYAKEMQSAIGKPIREVLKQQELNPQQVAAVRALVLEARKAQVTLLKTAYKLQSAVSDLSAGEGVKKKAYEMVTKYCVAVQKRFEKAITEAVEKNRGADRKINVDGFLKCGLGSKVVTSKLLGVGGSSLLNRLTNRGELAAVTRDLVKSTRPMRAMIRTLGTNAMPSKWNIRYNWKKKRLTDMGAAHVSKSHDDNVVKTLEKFAEPSLSSGKLQTKDGKPVSARAMRREVRQQVDGQVKAAIDDARSVDRKFKKVVKDPKAFMELLKASGKEVGAELLMGLWEQLMGVQLGARQKQTTKAEEPKAPVVPTIVHAGSDAAADGAATVSSSADPAVVNATLSGTGAVDPSATAAVVEPPFGPPAKVAA